MKKHPVICRMQVTGMQIVALPVLFSLILAEFEFVGTPRTFGVKARPFSLKDMIVCFERPGYSSLKDCRLARTVHTHDSCDEVLVLRMEFSKLYLFVEYRWYGSDVFGAQHIVVFPYCLWLLAIYSSTVVT